MRKRKIKPAVRKPENQVSHARKRAKQRLGIELENEQIAALIELAENNKCQGKWTDRKNLTHANVSIGELHIHIIYNARMRRMITLYPKPAQSRAFRNN